MYSKILGLDCRVCYKIRNYELATELSQCLMFFLSAKKNLMKLSIISVLIKFLFYFFKNNIFKI